MGSDIEIGYRERRARIHGERMGGAGRGEDGAGRPLRSQRGMLGIVPHRKLMVGECNIKGGGSPHSSG
jgi:hypothetical protein